MPIIVDVLGRPALHQAVLRGDETCLTTLLASGVHPDIRDMDGYTALMHASKAGHTSMVDRLLDARASTERHAYRTGDTALILACRDDISSASEGWHSGSVPFTSLLSRGAEPYRTNWAFGAPRGFVDGPRLQRFDELVAAKGWPQPKRAPLKNSPQELAERAMLDGIWTHHCGCDDAGPCSSCVPRLDSALDSGRTLLQTVAQEGLPCVLHGLLEAGATPDARVPGDATALALAATGNYPVIVAVLLDHNASIDAADGDGVTALQVACFAGFLEVARLLLWHGADVMAADHRGVGCRQLVDSRHAGSPLQLLIDHAEREAAGIIPAGDGNTDSSDGGNGGSNRSDTIFVSQARAQAAAAASAASAEDAQSPLGVAVALVLVGLCLVHRRRRRSAPLPSAGPAKPKRRARRGQRGQAAESAEGQNELESSGAEEEPTPASAPQVAEEQADGMQADPRDPSGTMKVAFEAALAELGDVALSPEATASLQMALQAGIDTMEDRELCVVCLNGKKTHAMIPCGHKCACAACGQLIMGQGGDGMCPICRHPALMVTGIYDA